MNYKVTLIIVLFFLTHHQFYAQDLDVNSIEVIDIDDLEFEEELNVPVVAKCQKSVDDFTGQVKVSTNQKRIVTIENEEAKAKANELWKKGVMLDYEMFVCALDVYKRGNVNGINIYLKFKTTKPLDFYGLLTEKSILEFKLKNDKIVKLNFIKITTPDVNFKYKYSTYSSQVLLTDNAIKELGESSISKIRIHFSEGYKSYDVTENFDLLIAQLKCITAD